MPAAAGAANQNCFIGVDNKSVLVNTTFGLMEQGSIPATLRRTISVVAKCSQNAGLPLGTYQWALTVRNLRFSMVSGTTPQNVLDAVSRSFSINSPALEVNNGPPGYTPTYQTSADATAVLAGRVSQLSVGQYLLQQDIDVQRRICSWDGSRLKCSNDAGGKKKFTAYYTLNVIAKLPSKPDPGLDPTVTLPTGVVPNPWTVPGAVRKFRCDHC